MTFAVTLAQAGWNVWSIEMTGGPTTECDDLLGCIL